MLKEEPQRSSSFHSRIFGIYRGKYLVGNEKGENVIVDTTKMSSQHIDELREAIQEKNLGSKIL